MFTHFFYWHKVFVVRAAENTLVVLKFEAKDFGRLGALECSKTIASIQILLVANRSQYPMEP